MAGYTFTLTNSWSDGMTALSGGIAVSGGAVTYVDQVVPHAGGSPTAYDLAFLEAAALSIYMIASVAVTVIFKKASGVTANTVSLVANQPVVWLPGLKLGDALLAHDIISITAQNVDPDNDSLFRIRVLTDPTVTTTNA